MKTVEKFGSIDIVNFAGCFKLYRNGNEVGGIYATKDEARDAAIKIERKRLGIVVRERRNAE